MRSIPVLLYHSLSDQSSPGFRRWTVAPRRFATHMEALAAEGYEPLTLTGAAELVSSRKALPSRPVVITFDDGFEDFLTEAVPRLGAHSFTATLYATTGYLGTTSRWLADLGEQGRRMLTSSDLARVAATGIEIGAHGHSHAMLDLLPGDALRADVAASRSILREVLGVDVSSFAYPHGYSNNEVRRAIREAGFQTACAVHDAMSTGLSETFEIPRIMVEHDTDDEMLLAKLRGVGLRGGRFRHTRASLWRARRAVWRRRHRRLAATLGT